LNWLHSTRNRFARKILILFLIHPLCLKAALQTADPSSWGSWEIEIIEFPDLKDRNREEPQSHDKARDRLFAKHRNQNATDANRKVPIKVHIPKSGGPFPVILVSHGAGGDWDTHYAQAQHLASHGYAVLCLEHVGSNRSRMMQGLRFSKILAAMIHDSKEVFARPKDVSFGMDCAGEWNRTHEILRGKLDPTKFGVMGHSFGAFTTMVVGGMRPALDWLTPRVDPGQGLGPDFHDSRMKCGVALSPQGVGEPFFIQASFGSLQVPLLGITGTEDRQQNGLPPQNRWEAFDLWPKGSHHFICITNGKHIDFTDSTGAKRKAMPSQTRKDVQTVVRAATLLFFDAHLKNNPGSAGQITADALKPYLSGVVNNLEVFSK
jgi:predicted dienelactone hydrolase